MGCEKKFLLDFTGKVVLITGAASGIGAATAKAFSKLGASIVMVDRDEKKLAKVAKKVMEIGEEPYAISADLLEPAEIKCVSKKTLRRFDGTLDVLVNCAGIMPMGTLESTSMNCLDQIMNINFRSMFYMTQLLLNALLESNGNIVNVSSICGLRAFPNLLAYNVSKAAIDHFTRSLSLDLGPKCVRVNAVNPGVIKTNLQRSGGMDEKSYKQFIERTKETTALGRAGKPEEVAAAICFLASPLASYITGVTLSVDGGKHVMCPR